MHDVIVIGSGIFGSVIARHLRELGQDVLVVDDARPNSGSKPAGCVIRPSWVSSLSKTELQSGLDLLGEYYCFSEEQFRIAGTPKRVTCYRVEPGRILQPPDRIGGVTFAREDGNGEFCAVAFEREMGTTVLTARHVIVAAGLWTPILCPWVKTWGRWGWSFRGPTAAEPTISVWAPYRQVVVFNMDDNCSWSGDGSALVERHANDAALTKSRDRCEKVLGGIVWTPTRGVRPYAETHGKPCLVSRRGRVIAVTGGAKNGTIAAAWAAREVEREMGL